LPKRIGGGKKASGILLTVAAPHTKRGKGNVMGSTGQTKAEKRSNAPGRTHEGRDDAASINRLERRRNRGGVEQADWASADPACVLRAIKAVSDIGGAIRFGYTRDGGSFAVGIYDGDEATTEYVRPTEDVNFYLVGVAEDFAQ
jgi:hypothetical protein